MDELKAIIARVNEADPVFEQPWEADAFVTAVTLSHLGYFEWKTWVAAFAGVIQSQPQREQETAHDAYYRQWLSCLEKVLDEAQLVPSAELLNREAKWRLAYLKTPHGSPVALAAAEGENEAHEHEHHHHHQACGEQAHSPAEIKPFRVFTGKNSAASALS